MHFFDLVQVQLGQHFGIQDILRNLQLNVTATITIDDVYIVALVFGTVFHGPWSCSAMAQLHDPLPQAQFSNILSKVLLDNMINVLDIFLLVFYNAN